MPVSGHLQELYGVAASPDLISRVPQAHSTTAFPLTYRPQLLYTEIAIIDRVQHKIGKFYVQFIQCVYRPFPR